MSVHTALTASGLQRENPFDRSSCDVMLPGATGFPQVVAPDAAAKAIVTPIPDATAKDGVWTRFEVLYPGADDYLTQPFSLCGADLAAAGAAALRCAEPRPTVLEAGELRCIQATRRVWLRGEQVDLTRPSSRSCSTC